MDDTITIDNEDKELNNHLSSKKEDKRFEDLISNPNKSISENNTPIPSPKMSNVETIDIDKKNGR